MVGHLWTAAVALFVGLVIATCGAYMVRVWDSSVFISHVDIEARVVVGAAGGRVLKVQYGGYHDEGCSDIVSHMLVSGAGDAEKDWPIGAPTVDMLVQLGQQHRVTMLFPIPSDLPGGDYQYVARATDFCEPIPGLIHPTPRRTRPVAVTVP